MAPAMAKIYIRDSSRTKGDYDEREGGSGTGEDTPQPDK